jgi:hypothetical protein
MELPTADPLHAAAVIPSRQGRNIVVALEQAEEPNTDPLVYALHEVLRPEDVLHVVHVACILPPAYTISHGKDGCSCC